MSCNNFPSPRHAFEIDNSPVLTSLNKLQRELFLWQQKNFKKQDTGIEWMALGAAEEVGEVCHVVLKARQKIRQHQAGMNEKALDDLADGVADTVLSHAAVLACWNRLR